MQDKNKVDELLTEITYHDIKGLGESAVSSYGAAIVTGSLISATAKQNYAIRTAIFKYLENRYDKTKLKNDLFETVKANMEDPELKNEILNIIAAIKLLSKAYSDGAGNQKEQNKQNDHKPKAYDNGQKNQKNRNRQIVYKAEGYQNKKNNQHGKRKNENKKP
jgi:hypothetical protein